MPRALDAAARRDALVDAVWTVTAREGLAAVTARAVAAQAGVSLGSVTRAFPTQEALHLEAMTALTARVTSRLEAASRPRPGDTPFAEGLRRLEQVVPLDDVTHVEALVYYDYLAHARTTASLRDVADEVDRSLWRLCDDVVSRIAPHRSPALREAFAEELHALTEGLAFGLVTWPHLRTRGQARRSIERWLERVGSRP